MKNSSKVKYFGAVAAALLAVAPIAAPVVSQVASPSVTQAASANPGDNAISSGQVTTIKSRLGDTYIGSAQSDDTSATKLLNLANSQYLSASSTTPQAAHDFFVAGGVGTGAASRFFKGNYDVAADNVFFPDQTRGTAFKYEISGNGLSNASSQADIINNIETAVNAGKGATYTVTFDIYDQSNNNQVIGQYPFTVTIPAAGQAGQLLASGSFKAASVNSGSATPGSIDSFASMQPDVSVKDGAGKSVTLSSATDFDLAKYSTEAVKPTTDQINAAQTWNYDAAVPAGSDVAQQLFTQRHLVTSNLRNYTGTGVFYQILPLRNKSTHVRDLVESIQTAAANAGVNLTQGQYINGSDLYYSPADNGTLYLVRPITVVASNTELAKPLFSYQYESAPSAAAQYFNNDTISLNSGDTDRLLVDNGTGATDYTKSATRTAAAINLLRNTRLTARENGLTNDAAPIAISEVTPADVRSAAVAAGVTFVSNDDTDAGYYVYANAKNFTVPVSVTNAAGFKTTVYIPASSHPSVQDEDAPVVELKQGVSKDITVQVGSNFQVSSLKDGLTVYTDKSKSKQLPEQYWVASPSSVDTSKAGKTDVIWTFTNPATGKKTTYTRTVTVVASDKSTFENTNGVISIQTSKAPQYTYDKDSDSFKKADSYTQLKLASAWKYNQKATTTNGDVYYRVSANGYVKASDVTTAKVTPQFGVVTVNNDNGTKTYANTTKDSGAVQSIKPDTSWKFFAVAVNPDGSRAYLVADNQWIPASDVVERVQAASGVFTVGSDVAPTFNGSGSVVKGKTLKARSAWKVTGVKNINGQPYYRIATDLYVRADYGSYAK